MNNITSDPVGVLREYLQQHPWLTTSEIAEFEQAIEAIEVFGHLAKSIHSVHTVKNAYGGLDDVIK
jgi:hypothetical protein